MRFATVAAALVCATSLSGPAWAESLPFAPLPSDFRTDSIDVVALGRHLFFDPVLSGNDNISCASCHHPALGSADGLSLGVGEGGVGLGAERKIEAKNRPVQRIPRNAPALFNVGAAEFTTMFHDGRVALDSSAMYGVKMPAGRDLERPVPSALAAQNILPLLSHDEMAGHEGENPVADAIAANKIQGPDGAWALIANEISEIPEYRAMFDWQIGKDTPVHITDIGRALSAFITYEFRSVNSPFDAYLRGYDAALNDAQMRGMELFYGPANCSSCHSGKFQTDHQFHSIGLPQVGPGKPDETGLASNAASDLGRAHVTGKAEDTYRFRTPSLRNVELTGPYGHNGAYASLEAMVRHHLDPLTGLGKYDRAQAVLASMEDDKVQDWTAMDDFSEVLRIAASVELKTTKLTDSEVADLMAFLGALTDPIAKTGRLGVPARVPSGLPLDPIGALNTSY